MNIRFSAALAAAIASLVFCAQAAAQSASPLNTNYSGSQELLHDFSVEQPQFYAPGARLFFSAHGEPGSHAWVNIANASGPQSIPMTETSRGTYEAFYTVKPYDNFSQPSFLAHFDKHGRSAQASASAYAPPPPAVCQNCGSIAAIREVEEGSPDANVPGIIAGGIIGGAIGDSVSGRHEHGAGTLLGAIIGSGIGSEIGRNENRRHIWIISVALDNGASQTFKNNAPPSAGLGARVRVENNQLILDRR